MGRIALILLVGDEEKHHLVIGDEDGIHTAMVHHSDGRHHGNRLFPYQ